MYITKENLRLRPLLIDLSHLNIADYLISNSFKRILIKFNIENIWEETLKNVSFFSTYLNFPIYQEANTELKSSSNEKTLYQILSKLLEAELNHFAYFIDAFLIDFFKYSNSKVNFSEVIKDLEVINIPDNFMLRIKKTLIITKKNVLNNNENAYFPYRSDNQIEQETITEGKHEKTETMKPNKIFISYSSIDRDLREIIEKRLNIYLCSTKNKFETVWADKEIRTGDDWNNVIQDALSESNVGILLVSPMFLGSKYSMGDELKTMLERRKSEGYLIIPVMLRECNFSNNNDLGAMQFFKTYQSEYDVTDLLKKDKLMPFDELVDIPKPSERLINKYFQSLANEIDKAVSATN